MRITCLGHKQVMKWFTDLEPFHNLCGFLRRSERRRRKRPPSHQLRSVALDDAPHRNVAAATDEGNDAGGGACAALSGRRRRFRGHARHSKPVTVRPQLRAGVSPQRELPRASHAASVLPWAAEAAGPMSHGAKPHQIWVFRCMNHSWRLLTARPCSRLSSSGHGIQRCCSAL